MRRCAIIFLLWLSTSIALTAQPWWEGNRVSPLYFGPNALPVPDMLDGRVAPRLYAELAGDIHKGFYGDMTETVSAKVNIPLFTPRVNLSVWMPVVEFYQYTPRALEHFQPREYTERGHQVGNVYVSVDIHVFRERRIMPDISVRAAIITASGDGDEYVCALLRCSGIFLRCLGRQVIQAGGGVLQECKGGGLRRFPLLAGDPDGAE